MTKGYELFVGSELVLNCSLTSKNFMDLPSPISSSDLVLKNLDFSNLDLSNFTHKIDDRTIQLRIPEATARDSAVYICEITVSPTERIPLCLSTVSVGYFGNVDPAHSPMVNLSYTDAQKYNSVLQISSKSNWVPNISIWIANIENPDREMWLLFQENIFNEKQSIREYSAEMTPGYDLLVGSELVLNCSLASINFIDLPSLINSSDLAIRTQNMNFSDVIQQIDDRTIQLKIPKAKADDSAFYFCEIIVAPNIIWPLCNSEVNVGYKPHITDYGCSIRNYDNLTCSWQIPSNSVNTHYEIETYFNNLKDFPIMCPNATAEQTSCVWTTETVPPFVPFYGNMSFTIKGSNSLGNSSNKFSSFGLEMFVPNSPEMLQTVDIGSTFINIRWYPPKMRKLAVVLDLEYEIWIGKRLYDPDDIQIFDAGNNTSRFVIANLIPYVEYNVSVRCRLFTTEFDNKWGPLASLVTKTHTDVPFRIPEVIPEAYEIHLYDDFRSVTLYWKTVPEVFHYGENFYYHIKYFQITPLGDLYLSSANTSIHMVRIDRLMMNAPYTFHVYSANHAGLSEDYETVIVDEQINILPGPLDIAAISLDLGYYNLSWIISEKLDNINYTVFWCPSSTPLLYRCDSEVEWVSEHLSEKNITLNLNDTKTDFQFAIVAKTENRTSGMQWASCIVPYKAALGKIFDVRIETKNATTLKVIWYLDCSAKKALVGRYEITYCRIHKNEGCKVTTVGPHSESYLLYHLNPSSNYSIKIKAFNKDNLPSEDSDAVFQTTPPAGRELRGLQTKMETFLMIVLGVCGFILTIVLFSCIRGILRRKRRKKEFDFMNHNQFEQGCTGFFNPNLPLESQIDLLPYQKKWEFSKDRLKLGKTLGQGAFGRVVKAEAIGLVAGEASTTVAVKMLKQTAEKEERKALIAELKILVHIGKHLNIVNLLGAVTKNLAKGDLYIIMEYCCYGNLRHFLLKHKDTFIDQLDRRTGKLDYHISPLHSSSFSNVGQYPNHTDLTHDEAKNDLANERTLTVTSSVGSGVDCFDDEYSQNSFLTTSDLLCFSFQSARGMDYLASRKLIHRDLAARNVLLAKGNVIKICDFGLAKDCYKYSNYVKKTKGMLPIKWLAIESIEDRVFTFKSDVWSFGILLWEIFTLGSSPYPGLEINEEFFKRLKNGYRMGKPEFALNEIYQLMKDCWLDDPNERPEFNFLAEKIGALMEENVRMYYMDLDAPYQEMNAKFFNDTGYLKMSRKNSEGYINMNSSDSKQATGKQHTNENLPSGSNVNPMTELKSLIGQWGLNKSKQESTEIQTDDFL